jgi:hypothetical protein
MNDLVRPANCSIEDGANPVFKPKIAGAAARREWVESLVHARERA